MANTIDRKINPEIPIVQESNRNEVYVPNASYTEPGVAGFFKTHFIVDDNGIVHLRKAPERAVSAVTYDSNTNTLIITFDDGTVQSIKLNDCACVDGVDLIVYDAFNVITFKESSWDTLDVNKVLVISAAMTGYDNDEIIVQLDKYRETITNVGDKSITSHYFTYSDYTIYKCTDGSLAMFAAQAFDGRFIILKREFAVQKNVANITYDDATGMLTIYYVTGDPVTLSIKFNIEPGTGDGAVQQIGAKANGKQAAAFGGLRYDKQTGRTPTSADGNQSFAAGGSVHADGDFSAVFGKDTIARQRASFAAGSSMAGMTEEEFNAFYWDNVNNMGLHGGSKNSDGEICDFTGAPYAKSFAFAAALGCDTQAKGARSFTAGDNTAAMNTGATAIGMNTKAFGTAATAEGYKTEAYGEHSHAGGGQFTRAVGFDSFAHGANAEAWADRSAAFGFETISASENGMAIGKQNVVRTDAILQAGNGTDYNNRKDAFVVLKDGRAKVQTAPSDNDDVVRKGDLGYDIDFPFGGPTEVRCDSTDGITVTGIMRIYLNQAKTVFHDVPNVSIEIPIFAGKNVTIDADETNKKAVVKASDIDVNTLISLLLGSNGIKLTKNEAGDRLLIGISRLGFELGTFEANGDGVKFAYNDGIAEEIYLGASSGGAIDIYNSLVSIDNYIRVKATADEYIEINNEDVIYHTASGVKHYLREDTVKTIGGQSIYGSGDIPIGGDIPSNINTFTEVHDVLTLTASDTLNTLSAKIVALGQSVIHVKANDTARAQVDRIMGNPSTGGPPTSYCDYWFKVLSEHLIYVLFGFGGEWGIINYLYNSAQHSPNEWSMCPRWMPIDPSKIAGGTADSLTLAIGLNIGTLGSDNEQPSYLKLTTNGIAYMLGSSAVSNALFSGGPIDNVKTFFGNQSIYGTSNIDLYNHTLVITATATNVSALKALITFTSSSNTKIDSLTDLYTACSKFGEISASGYVTKAGGLVCPIYSALCYSGDGIHFIEAALDNTAGLAWTAMTGITIKDTVTTV